MSDIKVGDYVEVDLGLALCARGKIISENAYRNGSGSKSYREHLLVNSMARTTGVTKHEPGSYKIKFIDGSTHTANPEEVRLLSEKEQFILKLKDGQDKELEKVYAALDERDA